MVYSSRPMSPPAAWLATTSETRIPVEGGLGRPMMCRPGFAVELLARDASTLKRASEQPRHRQAVEHPLVDEHRRCDPEGNHVRQRVELEPELTLGLGHARDAAVHQVEQHREHQEDRGAIHVVVAGAFLRHQPDRVEAAEHPSERDQIRQHEECFPKIELRSRATG
jgi:hypothetical protein